jgi:hypothetical protein
MEGGTAKDKISDPTRLPAPHPAPPSTGWAGLYLSTDSFYRKQPTQKAV